MEDFILGAKHITDLNGIDHILFLVALAASFDLSKLGRMTLLASAFTIGHCITLFLAGLDLVRASSAWIEFLIPLTIIFMAISAILGTSLVSACPSPSPSTSRTSRTSRSSTSLPFRFRSLTYIITIIFGLIHGLGFSSFYRIAVERGSGIVLPLLKFNLGVEFGQIIILLITLSIFSLARAFGASQRSQQLVVGGMTLGLAAMMAFQSHPF
jgi:hypothetical protein